MEQKNKVEIYKEERPWGKEQWFISAGYSMVKILTIKSGEKTSLQYHKGRNEFWHVLSGNGIVQIGEEQLSAEPGKEFFVEKEVVHRLVGGTPDLVLLEIATGHFDESDIVRLEDKYNRLK